MFITAAGTPIAYTDPWRASLEDRLAALVAGHRRVAYFYETPDAHTFRYRVFNMVQALAARPDLRLSAAWFTREDLDRTSDFVDRADLLIICRTRYDSRIGRLVARAKARGLTVLYDIDDLIFDLRHAHLVGDTIGRNFVSSEEWDWWVGYIGRLGMTLGLCDGASPRTRIWRNRLATSRHSSKPKSFPTSSIDSSWTSPATYIGASATANSGVTTMSTSATSVALRPTTKILQSYRELCLMS